MRVLPSYHVKGYARILVYKRRYDCKEGKDSKGSGDWVIGSGRWDKVFNDSLVISLPLPTYWCILTYVYP